jgi:hypothetical protein
MVHPLADISGFLSIRPFLPPTETLVLGIGRIRGAHFDGPAKVRLVMSPPFELVGPGRGGDDVDDQ